MKVIFFEVDNVLNFPDSDAIAPSGAKGAADSCIKKLRNILTETGARAVLFGKWAKEWDFAESKCTQDGLYLNKKTERKGLHILDKVNPVLAERDGIFDWLERHNNVTEYCVMKDINNPVEWSEHNE